FRSGTKPCLCKSQSQIESFLSVFLPRMPFTYFGLATTTSQSCSKILNTGCQYFPVDSIQTCLQDWDLSHSRRRSKSSVKVENCLVWYSVTPDWFVVPTVATTNFLWTSIPQQTGWTILSINTSPYSL